MGPLKTTGVVLGTHRAKNSSLVLTVLTPDLGKIRVWGRGVCNPKNPSHCVCNPFTYGEFVLFPRGEMYTLSAGEILSPFYHLRESIEKLSYGVYFLDLAGILCSEGVEAEEGLRLLLNTLHYLEKGLKDPKDLKLLFEIRMMAAAGFAPYLDGCLHCGREDAAVFSPEEGGLLCSTCSPRPGLSPAALSLLHGYAEKGLKTALDHTGGPETEQLAPLMESFVRHQLDFSPKSLEYLHRILHTVKE